MAVSAARRPGQKKMIPAHVTERLQDAPFELIFTNCVTHINAGGLKNLYTKTRFATVFGVRAVEWYVF